MHAVLESEVACLRVCEALTCMPLCVSAAWGRHSFSFFAAFRQAAALTAFTVALGALGPGIASMSEPLLTERGVLPVVDYGGALVLLPTMYWGISFGES